MPSKQEVNANTVNRTGHKPLKNQTKTRENLHELLHKEIVKYIGLTDVSVTCREDSLLVDK